MTPPTPPNYAAAPDARLAMMPATAIAIVLGYVAASDAARSTPGRLAALADELSRRGVYRDTLAALDPDLARRVDLLVIADRGQRWAARGRR